MKYKLLVLFIVFTLTCNAQIFVKQYEAIGIAVMKYPDTSFSNWQSTSMNVDIDYINQKINVYSVEGQLYDIKNPLSMADDSCKTTQFEAIDNKNRLCLIQFQEYTDGQKSLVIIYSIGAIALYLEEK